MKSIRTLHLNYEFLRVFYDRKIACIAFLGFSSGLPLALSGGTLQAWIATTPTDITTIGLLGLVGLPYTIKFLWAPVLDRFKLTQLGRRRSWMILSQLLISFVIVAIALTNPATHLFNLAILAMLLAFFSASQDIAFDAFRTDSLKNNERGAGAAVSVLGYRIAMLTSGALALIMADKIGFEKTFLFMAVLMIIGVVSSITSHEPYPNMKGPSSFHEAVSLPFKNFFQRGKIAIALISLVIFYKLGDAFAGSLTTTFLIRGPGFSLTEIGTINKSFGIFLSIVGALLGGGILSKIGLYKSLLIFGILQAVSNLTFMILAYAGKSYWLFIFAVGFEQLSGGMGTAAFVAFLMSLCDHRYTATQFALLSAASAIGRVFVGPPSGYLVDKLDWGPFFLITFIIALPGLFLLIALKKHLQQQNNTQFFLANR